MNKKEKKRRRRRKKKNKKRKINKKEKKNKNAPRFFFAFIKILESFEDRSILNLLRPCAIQ
jgi:hypothetical protein